MAAAHPTANATAGGHRPRASLYRSLLSLLHVGLVATGEQMSVCKAVEGQPGVVVRPGAVEQRLEVSEPGVVRVGAEVGREGFDVAIPIVRGDARSDRKTPERLACWELFQRRVEADGQHAHRRSAVGVDVAEEQDRDGRADARRQAPGALECPPCLCYQLAEARDLHVAAHLCEALTPFDSRTRATSNGTEGNRPERMPAMPHEFSPRGYSASFLVSCGV